MTATRRTALLLLASLILALSATPLTPAVRAVGPTTWLVAHEDEVLEYTEGSACADPDFWTDGSWSVGGSGDGAYNSEDDAIQDAIDNASSGDTIYVCFGRYDFDADLQIFDLGMNLTIVGDGIGETVFDGNDSTRLINANPAGGADSGGTLTLRDLSIEDAETETEFDNGGAVNADGLSLTRVSISGSDGAYNGGALYAEGNVTIVDSTFTNNDSSEDGAVLYAWNTLRSVTIRDSLFNANTAGQSGGAVIAHNVTVHGSTFTNNVAAVYAGAINAATVGVTGSTFTNNDANIGGAIFGTSVIVQSSRFTSNSAIYGGAIAAEATATISNSTFVANAASYGGAINANGSVTGSTFMNNSAIFAGGAIKAGLIAVSTSTFTSNVAVYGGAINSSSTTATMSTFARNSASNSGGAIYGGDGAISRSRFTRNSAGGHGGAVVFGAPNRDALRELRGNTFMRNAAPTGGAITLGPCGTPNRSEAARVERANRFLRNRATEQRRTRNIELRVGDCA